MILGRFIDHITERLSEVKILMTSKTPVQQFLGQTCTEIKIGPLKM